MTTETNQPVRVLLAEDSDLLLESFRALLDLQDSIAVVHAVRSGDEIVPAITRYRPDVAVLDIQMPGMDGVTACGLVRQRFPDCKVIMLTVMADANLLREALEAGASGFLVKSTSAGTLVSAIKNVSRGGVIVDPALATKAMRSSANPLTQKEMETLVLADQGLSTREIAQELHLAPGTVRNYLSAILAKLGARRRTEALAIARRSGWLH